MDPDRGWIRIGECPFRLAGDVECIAVSPNGTRLAAGAVFGDEVVVWERSSGRVLARVHKTCGDMGFASDEVLWLAYARLFRWDLTEPEPEAVDGDLGFPIAVSLHGRWVAATARPTETGEVEILDGARATRIRSIAGPSEQVRSLSLSADDRWLAIGYESRAALVDITTGLSRELSVPRRGRSVRVRFASAQDRLLVGREDGDEIVVTQSDGSVVGKMKLPEGLASYAVSADGTRLALSGIAADVFVIACPDGRVLGHSPKRTQDAVVAFVDQGRTIAVSRRHAIGFMDASTGAALAETDGHDDEVGAIAVSPDGSLLATGGGFDRSIRLWSTLDGRPVHTDRGHDIGLLSLTFSPTGDALVSGARDGTLRCFEVRTGRERFVIDSAHDNFDVTAVAWLPNGEGILSAGGDGNVVLRSPETGVVIRQIVSHPGQDLFMPPVVAVSHDATWVASIGAQGVLLVQDLAGGATVFSQPDVKSPLLAFAPDGPSLAFCCGSDIIVVELPSGRQVCEHSFMTPSRIAFGSDGVLACIQYADSVQLLDTKRGELRFTWGSEQGIPTEVAFSPDRRLAIGYAHGAAALVPVPERKLTAADRLETQRAKNRKLVLGLVAELAEHREIRGYRDAPSASDLDPDRCGVRIVRSGATVHLRVAPADEGYLVEVRAIDSTVLTRQGGAPSGAQTSGIGKVVAWIRGKVEAANARAEEVDAAWLIEALGEGAEGSGRSRWEGETLVVTCELSLLPTLRQLERLAQACADLALARSLSSEP